MTQNDNSGSLFVNDRKEKDSHPDFTGSCMIGGVEYWMSAWKKDSGGKKRLSFSFKPKEQKPAAAQQEDAGNDPW